MHKNVESHKKSKMFCHILGMKFFLINNNNNKNNNNNNNNNSLQRGRQLEQNKLKFTLSIILSYKCRPFINKLASSARILIDDASFLVKGLHMQRRILRRTLT